MTVPVVFDLHPLKLEDIPDPSTAEFQAFLDDRFAAGQQLIGTLTQWSKHSKQHDGTVQVYTLPTSSSYNQIRKPLGVKEFWCGRHSSHTTATLPPSRPATPNHLSFARRLSSHFGLGDSKDAAGVAGGHAKVLSDVERQERIFQSPPNGPYERFRRGLLEYHSENEREYIESCRETQCLHVFQPHVAEVWRLTYVTPPPTSPRTFVVLLLSRELVSEPRGARSFMNISIPFAHSDCPEKQGPEKSRCRGKYVSVELVTEEDGGARVDWKMATSSDAGGNIPRFVTNTSLPSKISEDVPAFLGWMVRRFPDGGEVASTPASELTEAAEP
ncbi:hypothetical protein Q5752_000769 [Cryptotrichosporon argae]